MENIFQNRKLIFASFFVLLCLGLITRLDMINLAEYPGNGDHAFYYTVAENIYEGKGLQTDYIWTYLSNPETITHSSNDFWMPFTAIIIGQSLILFGKSLSAALIPSIIAGLLLSVVVYFLAKKITDSRFVALCSASLVLFMPHLFSNSLLTDSPIYYALFVNFALLFMVIGWDEPKYFLLSALFAGLAHLTRQDGVLLFLALELIIILSPISWNKKLAHTFMASCIYVLILTPLLISNFRTFGLPFPPGPSKTMFLTQYEDLYSYSEEINLNNYMDWGTQNILRSKINGLFGNAKVIYDRFLGTFLKVFFVVGTLMLLTSPQKGKKLVKYLPAFIFLFFLFIFYSLVVPVSSGGAGFTRSSMSMIPIIVIVAIDTINKIVPNKAVAVVIILLIVFSSWGKSIQFTRDQLAENTRLGEEMERLNQVIINDIHDEEKDEIVIMTRIPWQVYHTTRHKAIQIPNDDLDTIYEVALKYGANYLLLPAPRDALMDIYNGKKADERFVLMREIPDSDLKLFEIKIDR